MPSRWMPTLPAAGTPPASGEIRQMWLALQSLYGINLAADAAQLIWPYGDSSRPAHYFLTDATIARCGPGLADTENFIAGWTAKVTGSGTTGKYGQRLLPAGSFAAYFKGKYVSPGVAVKCASVNSARLVVDDGAATSESAWCPTLGWNWLTVSHEIDAAATKLEARVEVADGIAAYVQGLTPWLGEVPPPYYVPSLSVVGSLPLAVPGTLSTGTNKRRFTFGRPAFVKHVHLDVEAAPGGAKVICDLNHWDGAAWQSMFTARPEVAIGALAGHAAPDGTYRYRCFDGGFGTSRDDARVSLDIDQVGTPGTQGAELGVRVLVLQFARPLEAHLGYAELGA